MLLNNTEIDNVADCIKCTTIFNTTVKQNCLLTKTFKKKTIVKITVVKLMQNTLVQSETNLELYL